MQFTAGRRAWDGDKKIAGVALKFWPKCTQLIPSIALEKLIIR